MKYKILVLAFYPPVYKDRELNKFHKEVCALYNPNEDCAVFENKDTCIKAIRILKLKWPSDIFTIKEIY